MKYLLDTNAVIQLLNATSPKLTSRLRSEKPYMIGVSSIVLQELFYGAFKSQRIEDNLAKVDKLQFDIVEFDREDARAAGQIRATLAQKGRPIGAFDVLIAGQAMARELVLVSHNVKEFGRLPDLLIEDWEI